MSKEKDHKKVSDKTPACKSTREKRVDKFAKRKDNRVRLTDL
jgi:hypothetical protein